MFELNYQKKADEIIAFIKDAVTTAGLADVVVAVSGGVDSAVSLALAVKAFGREHVYAVMLPYGDLSKKGVEDAKVVIEKLHIPQDHIFTIDIKEGVDALIAKTKEMTDIRRGNMMARVRMIYLFDMAKKFNALVLGTENKTEHYLGYFTRFGDEASDVEPIRGLYKIQVWEMAKYLEVPEQIITKAPSAGLWDGQSDEGEFGFSYADADRILYHHFEEKLPLEGIVSLGFEKNLVENVLSFVQKNEFKHHLPKVMD